MQPIFDVREPAKGQKFVKFDRAQAPEEQKCCDFEHH